MAKKHILHYIKNIACIICMIFFAYEDNWAKKMFNAEMESGYLVMSFLLRIGFGVAAGLLFVEFVSWKKISNVWMVTLTIVLGFFTMLGMSFGSPLSSTISTTVNSVHPPLGIALDYFYFVVPYVFGIWLVVLFANIIKRCSAAKEN